MIPLALGTQTAGSIVWSLTSTTRNTSFVASAFRATEGTWAHGNQGDDEVIGKSGNTGGFRVHRYIDKSGRECAYYDTTLAFPSNAVNYNEQPTGVHVLDMSDPSKPRRTASA